MGQSQSPETAQQRDQSEKPDLAIGELRDAVKSIAPLSWKEERNDAFK